MNFIFNFVVVNLIFQNDNAQVIIYIRYSFSVACHRM